MIAGPRTFVVVPPAVAVSSGAALLVPDDTGARTMNPPMSFPPLESGSATSVTVPYVTPVCDSASAENCDGVVTSVGMHIAAMT